MTDKEQIAMLREALITCFTLRNGDQCYNVPKVEAALAATAPSAQGQEKVDGRAALKALVQAKDYKDRYGKDQVYERMQLAAWKQARAALRSE